MVTPQVGGGVLDIVVDASFPGGDALGGFGREAIRERLEAVSDMLPQARA